MISQTAEYALRAMLFMSEHDHDMLVTSEVAAATHVPAGYLSKVLQSLQRAGLVASQRGLGGGFSLAKPPAQTTIYEIIQAVDPIRRIRSCPLKLATHKDRLCPLHRRLDKALALVEKSFRETTVAELLAERPEAPASFIFPWERQEQHQRAAKTRQTARQEAAIS
jgi:Rrf2 family nitric oxide-sensitive transcriptional repressor